jgi:hypothetical protein
VPDVHDCFQGLDGLGVRGIARVDQSQRYNYTATTSWDDRSCFKKLIMYFVGVKPELSASGSPPLHPALDITVFAYHCTPSPSLAEMSDTSSSNAGSPLGSTPPTSQPPSPAMSNLSLQDVSAEDKQEAARLKAQANVCFKSMH